MNSNIRVLAIGTTLLIGLAAITKPARADGNWVQFLDWQPNSYCADGKDFNAGYPSQHIGAGNGKVYLMGCYERANQNGFNDAQIFVYDNFSWSAVDGGFGEQLAIDPSTAYPWVITTDSNIYSWDPAYHWFRRQDIPATSASHIGLANSTAAYVLGGAGCADAGR